MPKHPAKRIRADRRITARKTPLRKKIVVEDRPRSRNEVARNRAAAAATEQMNTLIRNTRSSNKVAQGFASDKRAALKAINKTLDANRRVLKTIKKRTR